MWEYWPVVGIGDLVIDLIYKDGKLLGVDGGGSTWNTLCNISQADGICYAYGVCGDDPAGQIAIKSLENCNVDTKMIIKKDIYTKRIHENIHDNCTDPSLMCPQCGKTAWYTSSYLPKRKPPEFVYLREGGILLFDSIKKEKMEYAESVREFGWKIAADIGHIGNMRYMQKNDVKNIFKKKFDIIQINSKVSEYIKKCLKMENNDDLFEFLEADVTIITDAKNGLIVFTKHGKTIISQVEIFGDNVTDETGAGDACFSGFIFNYSKADFYNNPNEKYIKTSVTMAKELIKSTLMHVGSRGHINNYYKIDELIKHDKDVCQICGIPKQNKKNALIQLEN